MKRWVWAPRLSPAGAASKPPNWLLASSWDPTQQEGGSWRVILMFNTSQSDLYNLSSSSWITQNRSLRTLVPKTLREVWCPWARRSPCTPSPLPLAIAASSSSWNTWGRLPAQSPHLFSPLGGAEHDALLMFRTHSFSFSVFSLWCCPLGELSLVFPCRRASCPITDDPISALLSCERTEYEWVVGGGRGERKTYQGEHINIAKYHRITAKPRK